MTNSVRGILVRSVPYLALFAALTLVCVFFARSIWRANSAQKSEPLPLLFEQSSMDFGDMRDNADVKHEFTFRVWAKGPVTIEQMGSTCRCAEVESNLAQMTLEPNSTHTFRVKMHVADRPGFNDAGIYLVTDPPSPRPLMVTLRAYRVGHPRISPNELFVKTNPGTIPQGILYVNYQRRHNSPALQLNKDNCQFGPFVLYRTKAQSEAEALRNEDVDPADLDHLELTLKGKEPFPVGTHTHSIQLAWKGDHPRVTVPVSVTVEHPFRPVVSQVFCGELSAGEVWNYDVYLVRHGTNNIVLDSVACDKDFVEITAKEKGACIGIKVKAPQSAGRFRAVATLRYAQESAPPFSLPITGIVKPAKQ